MQYGDLVAPYCAIPRDYLSDTPLSLRAMGVFWCLDMANGVAITPSPLFLSFSPLGEYAKWRCDTHPPLKRGISAILARYPMKTKAQWVRYPPSAILSRRVLRDMGGGLGLAAKYGDSIHYGGKALKVIF